MTLKDLKKNKYVRFFSNRYLLIFLVFLVWMIGFDDNSFLKDHKFNQEIDELEADKEYYQYEINSDKKKLEKLEDEEEIQKYAREEYHMKQEDEDIYIIEYDTIK